MIEYTVSPGSTVYVLSTVSGTTPGVLLGVGRDQAVRTANAENARREGTREPKLRISEAQVWNPAVPDIDDDVDAAEAATLPPGALVARLDEDNMPTALPPLLRLTSGRWVSVVLVDRLGTGMPPIEHELSSEVRYRVLWRPEVPG